MTVGDRIRIKRKEKKLSQKQLSQESGVSEISIRQYENHKRNPKIEQLHRIANALDISIDYFLGSNGDSTPPNKKDPSPEAEEDYIFIIGKNGIRQKYPVPHEKVEQFRKLLDVVMPEILASEEDDK